MMYTTHVSTQFGTFHLIGNNQGLTNIFLPGTDRAGKKTSQTGSNQIPDFLRRAAQQIKEYSQGKRTEFTAPISPQGSPFQVQVWEIIHAIPYGQTMSYGEIAEHLGNKNKARAVGGAANANPLPLVIPCHRVVGSDGSLTGFAGGLPLKRALLNLEKQS